MKIDLSKAQKQLHDKVEQELEKQLREIPKTVEKVVESAVLSIIGVKRQGNGYGVDTWGKREEALNSYIKRKTEEKVEEIVGPYVDKELKRLFKLVTLRKAITAQIQSSIHYQFESAFKKKVGERFEELGEKLGANVADELDKMMADVATFNDDIFDPGSFQGRIGNLFLEEIAEQTASSPED